VPRWHARLLREVGTISAESRSIPTFVEPLIDSELRNYRRWEPRARRRLEAAR
jgi:hypothetical protein